MSTTNIGMAVVARELRTAVADKTGRTDIRCEIVPKINDTFKYGLIIGDGKGKPAPTIYIDKYIAGIQKGTYPLEMVAEELAEVIAKTGSSISDTQEGNMEIVKDGGQIMEKSFLQIIDPKWNRQYMKNLVHFQTTNCQGMECLIRVKVDEDRSFLVTEKLLERYGVDKHELIGRAWRNTASQPCIVRKVSDVLRKIYGTEEGNETHYDDPLTLMTYGEYGATVMCCGTLDLYSLADKVHSDLFIIPSSIHEILVIADDGLMNADELTGMIREINQTTVSREEQLSDGLFLFERATGAVKRLTA